jgi:ABC-type multidrug transport system fused ATPase/permease subunit
VMMSIESVAGRTRYRQRTARRGQLRSLADRALLGRIWRFAGRHPRRLGGFVAVSVASALLAVVTPMLAGRVVEAIVHGGARTTVLLPALVTAAVALAEAAVSLVSRWLSSTIGDHVQKMPVAFGEDVVAA